MKGFSLYVRENFAAVKERMETSESGNRGRVKVAHGDVMKQLGTLYKAATATTIEKKTSPTAVGASTTAELHSTFSSPSSSAIPPLCSDDEFEDRRSDGGDDDDNDIRKVEIGMKKMSMCVSTVEGRLVDRLVFEVDKEIIVIDDD